MAQRRNNRGHRAGDKLASSRSRTLRRTPAPSAADSSASVAKARNKRRRRPSRHQRAIYRRRRIAAVVVLALVALCVYSIARGIGAIGTVINHKDIYAISRTAVPDPSQIRKSGVKDCRADDLSVHLTSESPSVPVGGAMQFTQTVRYNGTSKTGCLADVSASNLVLTIASGDEVIYKSDVCPSDTRTLLFSPAGKEDKASVTWNANANATLKECTDEQEWPKVNAGTYVARLAMKDAPKIKSDKVVFAVQ